MAFDCVSTGFSWLHAISIRMRMKSEVLALVPAGLLTACALVCFTPAVDFTLIPFSARPSASLTGRHPGKRRFGSCAWPTDGKVRLVGVPAILVGSCEGWRLQTGKRTTICSTLAARDVGPHYHPPSMATKPTLECAGRLSRKHGRIQGGLGDAWSVEMNEAQETEPGNSKKFKNCRDETH